VSAFRIAEIAGPARARQILAFLVREGRAIHMGDLWFAREVVDRLRTRVLGHLSTAGKLTVAEFKELGALPRKQAVLLLEHFDQTKVTRRAGETRVLFSAAAKTTEREIE
jgi:selenocysteine-specific elongation factor